MTRNDRWFLGMMVIAISLVVLFVVALLDDEEPVTCDNYRMPTEVRACIELTASAEGRR